MLRRVLLILILDYSTSNTYSQFKMYYENEWLLHPYPSQIQEKQEIWKWYSGKEYRIYVRSNQMQRKGGKVLRMTKVIYPFYHSKNEKGLDNFVWNFYHLLTKCLWRFCLKKIITLLSEFPLLLLIFFVSFG